MGPRFRGLEVLRCDEAADAQLADKAIMDEMLLLLLLLKPCATALSVVPRRVIVSLKQQQQLRRLHHVCACIGNAAASSQRLLPLQASSGYCFTRGIKQRPHRPRSNGKLVRLNDGARGERKGTARQHHRCRRSPDGD
jgi:hypothetical protein